MVGFQVPGSVVGWQCDGSGWSGDGDASVGVDGLDVPVVAVPDGGSLVGAKGAVVAAGDDLVSPPRRSLRRLGGVLSGRRFRRGGIGSVGRDG